jgi:excisionase family DNA binding protein
MEKQTFNSQEAARYLCVSHSKFMKMCHKKEIEYSKCGRRNILTLEQLQSYLANHVVSTNEQLAENANKQLLLVNHK